MGNFFGSIWWMIVTLGVLVTFHEYGHYIVARRFGVKVLRFSVGFGRALWKRTGRDGTEYQIAAIPLGGYVKFLDAREYDVPEAMMHEEYNGKHPLKRMAIAAAGPAFNVLFALVAFWAMFVIGKPDYPPVVGDVSGLAAEAGFQSGDRIVKFGDKPVYAWTDILVRTIEAGIVREDVPLSVTDASGAGQVRILKFSRLAPAMEGGAMFEAIGLERLGGRIPAIADDIKPDTAAAAAGIVAGDRIVAINDQPVRDFEQLRSLIQAEAAKSPVLKTEIERHGEHLTVSLTARKSDDATDKTPWKIGMAPAPPKAEERTAVRRLGVFEAIPAAFTELRDQTASTFLLIRKMVSGEVSSKNLSGVVGIAQVANASAQMGLAWFISFLGLMSLSLAILNLLPIPILDGGHLVYYLIELVKGGPVSERTQIAGQYVGLVLIVTLVGIALYNDIFRNIGLH